MKHSERRRRTKLAVVRLLPSEHAALVREAERRQISVGALIRERLVGVIGSATKGLEHV